MISKHKGTLDSEERMRDAGVDEKSINYFISDAKEELAILKSIQKSLAEGNFSEKIENECASLGIRPANSGETK
jgi:hypothetical protein